MARPTDFDDQLGKARYEFRVWGRHERARTMLADLATEVTTEVVDDCYFLGPAAGMNVKVRDRILKVKQLVERTRGFERWASSRYHASEAAPAPFDELFERLGRARERYGRSFDLSKAVARLDDEEAARALLVTKHRTRFRIGQLRAEVTDITVDRTGEVLRTIAIEGDDIDELVALRTRLGLEGSPNVAVHLALDADR